MNTMPAETACRSYPDGEGESFEAQVVSFQKC